MAVTSAPVPPIFPPTSAAMFWRALHQPRGIVTLLLLVWVPLSLYVMAAELLGPARWWTLLPAIPAALLLYGMAMAATRESWTARIGLTIVFFWVLVAVTVPYLPLLDPNKPIRPFLVPGSAAGDLTFWLGTDLRGRDMLARALWGCQRVMVWGITATFAAYVVGCLLGLVAGYIGGWWDEIISFIANVLLSFPVMVLFILVLNYLGPSGFNIIVAVVFASAPGIIRIVRGLTLDIKTRDYVYAAQTRGESAWYIMLFELLPNVRGPIIVDACLRLGYTTVAITTLTFVGLGLQPPDPDWGLMIRESTRAAMLWKYAYMLLIPALSVSSLILGFNLLADGLREMSLKD